MKKDNSERYVVERTYAIVKLWCGGRSAAAAYWDLERVSIQMILVSIASNVKRWVNLIADCVRIAPAAA